jgi:MarR family transcriptional regulator for hemolysin
MRRTVAPARQLVEQIETIANALRHELFVGVDEEDLRVCMRVHGHILANLEKS